MSIAASSSSAIGTSAPGDLGASVAQSAKLFIEWRESNPSTTMAHIASSWYVDASFHHCVMIVSFLDTLHSNLTHEWHEWHETSSIEMYSLKETNSDQGNKVEWNSQIFLSSKRSKVFLKRYSSMPYDWNGAWKCMEYFCIIFTPQSHTVNDMSMFHKSGSVLSGESFVRVLARWNLAPFPAPGNTCLTAWLKVTSQ